MRLLTIAALLGLPAAPLAPPVLADEVSASGPLGPPVLADEVSASAPAALPVLTDEASASGPTAPALHAGSFETGIAGALVGRSGSTNIQLAWRFGWLLPGGPGLVPIELEASWSHVRMSDTVDFLVAGQYTGAIPKAPTVWPFVGVVAGLRQEWLGSFHESRFPVGPVVGLRVLVAENAAIRTEYRALRLLDDPVADYWEHRLLVGISIFFGDET